MSTVLLAAVVRPLLAAPAASQPARRRVVPRCLWRRLQSRVKVVVVAAVVRPLLAAPAAPQLAPANLVLLWLW